MKKFLLAAIKFHPFAVLAVYFLLVAGYCRYLDSSLKYIRPNLPAAPEDILGLGFWVPWMFVAVWFSVASYLSYRYGEQRKACYWIPLACVFGVLSVVDFYLYRVLEPQVLAGRQPILYLWALRKIATEAGSDPARYGLGEITGKHRIS